MASDKPNAKPAKTEEETLAECIRKLSRGVESLTRSGLNRRAVIVLLKDQTGVSLQTCADIIAGLAQLEKTYCR